MYLIIGSKGQLGSELELILGDKAHYADIEQLDITREQEVLDYITGAQPGYIINCAAYTAVDKAEEDEETAYRINAVGVKNLAKATSVIGAKLIHVSTDYVFDGTACSPYVETDATKPASAYGRTKLAGEQLALQSGGTVAIVRTSWLYSRFGNNFVKTMQRLGDEREALNVVFDQVGTPTNAADLAAALVKMAHMIKEGSKEVYHYSNEGVTSWYDFAVEIMKMSRLSCSVSPIRSSFYPTPATRPSYSVLDKGKIKLAFDLHIPHWRDSLGALLLDGGN